VRKEGNEMRTPTILITLMSKHKWRVLFAALASVATTTVLFAASVSAQETITSQDTQKAPVTTSARQHFFVRTSTKPQSGDIAIQAENAHITAPNNPFHLKKTCNYLIGGPGPEDLSINTIIITATMRDGKTASGDIDHNDLFLALDGVNTGIKLNGFRADHLDTRTVMAEGGALNRLLGRDRQVLWNRLKNDCNLKATIIDRDPADNNRVSLPANFETKLSIHLVR
jgi:hypothetical protein